MRKWQNTQKHHTQESQVVALSQQVTTRLQGTDNRVVLCAVQEMREDDLLITVIPAVVIKIIIFFKTNKAQDCRGLSQVLS